MNSPEQQKRDRDWSLLSGQVVGAENFPDPSIDELKRRISELEAKLLAEQAAGAEMREAVGDLIMFVRYEEFPTAGSAKFSKFMALCDKIDTIYRKPICGKALLEERERHVKALKEIIAKTGGMSVGPAVRANEIAREALKTKDFSTSKPTTKN